MEQIRVTGKSVSDLSNIAVHNIAVHTIESDEDDKRLQRQIVYSHIDAKLAKQCQAVIEQKAQEPMGELNTMLAVVRIKTNQKR